MNNLKVAREPFPGLKLVSLVAFLYPSGWQVFQGGVLAVLCACSTPSGPQMLGGNNNSKSMVPVSNNSNPQIEKVALLADSGECKPV